MQTGGCQIRRRRAEAPIPERRKSGEYGAENAENRGRRSCEKPPEELANRPKLQLKKRETPVGELTGVQVLWRRETERRGIESFRQRLVRRQAIEEAKLVEKKRFVAEWVKRRKTAVQVERWAMLAESKEEQELKDKIALLRKKMKATLR